MDVCFFNGGIRNSEQEHLAKLLRKKAKYIVAFGACAQLGGVPGLANLSNRRDIFDRVYHTTESTDNVAGTEPQTRHILPEGSSEIPVFQESVRPLDQVIAVDYYLPGCPPPPKLVFNAIDAIAKGQLPPKGSILAPELAVCDECPRKKEEKKVASIKRIIDFTPEPEKCLLEQGLVCMGPATRGGCDAKCLGANMPCTGCGGACPGAIEQGSAMISALSTVLGLADEKGEDYDVDAVVAQLKDPVGTFYKYALPASIIGRRVKK
jgi:F420-non-reducing hydrogenase small subunit